MARKRLFIDMDGTLAKFHDEVNYLERMYEKDFFRNLAPFENLIEGIKQFNEAYPDVELFILSATVQGEPPYCQTEKHAWCDKHLPFIDREHRIFTPVGRNKTEFIPGIITKDDYLYDDYNINLEEWQQAGGHSIKCKNNINHKGLVGALWQGDIIDNSKTPTSIVGELAFFMELPPDSLQQLMSKGRGR
jgi:5'(3')-deoxyribonucleotidase